MQENRWEQIEDWAQRQMAAFDRLPKPVREALREYPRSVNVVKFRRMARTSDEMLKVIASGNAPLMRD
jgi:hypothetical protein